MSDYNVFTLICPHGLDSLRERHLFSLSQPRSQGPFSTRSRERSLGTRLSLSMDEIKRRPKIYGFHLTSSPPWFYFYAQHHGRLFTLLKTIYRELKWLRGRRHLARHKFAYLTMKNNSFARFACASFFFFKHFVKWPVLKLSGQRQHLTTDFHYLHSISKPLTPILFQLVHILPAEQFGIMGKWLHKTRSHIFRCSSSFARLRPCSLLKLPSTVRSWGRFGITLR